MSPTSYRTAPLRVVIKLIVGLVLPVLVPETGIEPVRGYKPRRILSPVRLPVPPLRLKPSIPKRLYHYMSVIFDCQ